MLNLILISVEFNIIRDLKVFSLKIVRGVEWLKSQPGGSTASTLNN